MSKRLKDENAALAFKVKNPANVKALSQE
jgi:hypothetical protein